MRRGYVLPLLLLAAIWGSSFMFISIALRDLAPSTLILYRMASGASSGPGIRIGRMISRISPLRQKR